MNKNIITILQVILVIIGLCVLTFLLWEPHFEGRNINATAYQIYFNDPFLIYAYIASIPFFTILYKAFKILGLARKGDLLSQEVLKSLKTIKLCAISIICFVWIGVFYVIFTQEEDMPPLVFMSLLVTLVAGAIEITARRYGKVLHNSLSTRF